MNVTIVMDPLEGIAPHGDTTVALMEAAQAAGHALFFTEMHNLGAVGGRSTARVRRLSVCPWFTAGEPEIVYLDEMGAVLIRTDPPFDQGYLWGMYLLDLLDRSCVRVINDPAGIRAANEKLYALQFPELIPPTLVTADGEAITSFVHTHGSSVIKPVDGHAGHGVLVLRRDDPNLRSIVQLQTHSGSVPAVVQAYLAGVAHGNRRIFMVDGEPLASVNRLPVDGDFRTGDVTEVLGLTDEEQSVCAALAPQLRRDGLRFVGLDVIDGRLIEVNVTSPGGLRQLERLSGQPIASEIMRRLLEANPEPRQRADSTGEAPGSALLLQSMLRLLTERPEGVPHQVLKEALYEAGVLPANATDSPERIGPELNGRMRHSVAMGSSIADG